MQLTCPECQTRFPLAAGFADDDGKRLAALLAGMEPTLGRAVIGYLRLFNPGKQGLRTSRAVKLVTELQALVQACDVCRDERGGVRRPATPALWAEGIEQMLAQSDGLTLPLTHHHYLRAIVYGVADKADADSERARENALRAPRAPTPAAAQAYDLDLHEARMRIETDRQLGLIDDAEAAKRMRALARPRGTPT
jgi:hypothetical protein